MRENPDRGPIFDTCDNLAESFRLHRPGLLFAARNVMEHGTVACLVYCALMVVAPVEAPSMAALPRKDNQQTISAGPPCSAKSLVQRWRSTRGWGGPGQCARCGAPRSAPGG